jgi:3-hydroxyacyl-[acyl-carrier-protein] dehydratase
MEQPENIIEIQNYLPHRAPMLMVDVIHELSDHAVKTVLEIKAENIFVENKLFAEIGLVENAAQTCSAIVAKSYYVDENNVEKGDVNVIGFISGVKKLKVYDLAKIGDVIQTQAILVSRFDADGYSICTMSCSTFNDENLIFEAEINLFLQEQ